MCLSFVLDFFFRSHSIRIRTFLSFQPTQVRLKWNERGVRWLAWFQLGQFFQIKNCARHTNSSKINIFFMELRAEERNRNQCAQCGNRIKRWNVSEWLWVYLRMGMGSTAPLLNFVYWHSQSQFMNEITRYFSWFSFVVFSSWFND